MSWELWVLEYWVSLYNKPWFSFVVWKDAGRLGICGLESPFDDRSRDKRRSQDMLLNEGKE